MRLQRRIWHIEKQSRGQYHNSPPVWSYCGSIRAKTVEEALERAMFTVGSSLVRVMPEFELPEDEKGYL